MVVSRGIQLIFWGKEAPMFSTLETECSQAFFVLLDFIFMLCLTLCYGNQVADCCLEHKSAHSSWLEAEPALQAGQGMWKCLGQHRQLWGWALLTPHSHVVTKNCCCLPQKMCVLSLKMALPEVKAVQFRQFYPILLIIPMVIL